MWMPWYLLINHTIRDDLFLSIGAFYYQISSEVMAWVSNHNHIFLCDAIAYTCQTSAVL